MDGSVGNLRTFYAVNAQLSLQSASSPNGRYLAAYFAADGKKTPEDFETITPGARLKGQPFMVSKYGDSIGKKASQVQEHVIGTSRTHCLPPRLLLHIANCLKIPRQLGVVFVFQSKKRCV